VFNMLLQILDNGHLTDAKGRTVNFKNTIIILTSNIGSEFLQEMGRLGFATVDEDTREQEEETMREKIKMSLERRFRPEFLNRLDEIIVFSSLTPGVLEKIVEVQLAQVARRMERREIKVFFTPAVKKFLAEKGYSAQYGARPLKRAIQRSVLNVLAQEIISGQVRAGDALTLDVQHDQIEIFKETAGVHPG
jgi:ATP-dependent Clp protease ATP-binding subunit ClpC